MTIAETRGKSKIYICRPWYQLIKALFTTNMLTEQSRDFVCVEELFSVCLELSVMNLPKSRKVGRNPQAQQSLVCLEKGWKVSVEVVPA
jgi:hypothetical protein